MCLLIWLRFSYCPWVCFDETISYYEYNQQNDMMDKIADIAYIMPINFTLHVKVILAQHE